MIPARDDDDPSDQDGESELGSDLSPADAIADRDRKLALEVMTGMQAMIRALQAENWRYAAEKAARDALPQVWWALKPAAADVSEPYQNVRKWCERGLIVAEMRGGRWFCEMGSLREHIAAKRRK